MRFEHFTIERFAELRGLSMTALSPGVNVIYSQDAAQRASLARFVRWMIYGDADERIDAAGSITISEGARRETFTRSETLARSEPFTRRAHGFYDPLRAITQENVVLSGSDSIVGWIDNVSCDDFTTLCLPGADRVMRIQDLLSACRSHGIQLTSGETGHARLRELQLRREYLQRQLQQLPWRGRDLQGLLDRQRVLQQNLHGVELALHHRRKDVESERRSIATQLRELEEQLECKRDELRQLEVEIGDRRRVLEDAWQESQDAHRQAMAFRRQELAKLESSIQRARDMLAELYQRREMILDPKRLFSDRTRQARQEEVQQLDLTETSLQAWIDGLRKQRDQLLDELNHGDRAEYVVQPQSSLSWWYPSARPANPAERDVAPLPWSRFNPQDDVPLKSMIERRDQLDRAIVQLDRQLTQLNNHGRDLDDQRWNVRAGEAESLRREIAEVETLIRIAEDRGRLEREIAELDSEIDTIGDDRRSHSVIRDASSLLGRISGMELRAIRLLDPQRVEVDSPRNGWLTLDQLASSQRAMVYLSLLLAVNAGLRQSHWKLPLFVETSYLDLPHATFVRVAEEMERLARGGVQLVVLTSDYGFGRLLAARGARWYDLLPRAEAMPPAEHTDSEPSFDSIRFRTQGNPPNTAGADVPEPLRAGPRIKRQRRIPRDPVRGDQRRRQGANPLPDRVPLQRPQPEPAVSGPQPAVPTPSLRFFLDTTDAIMLAPAIGPSTARRLQQAGILTIANLLAADPAQLAKQLKNRAITPEKIAGWQAQANLMNCVPNLRGHEARILVACGIQQVDQLRLIAENDLWQRVRPFLHTNECRRIVRDGQMPDPSCVARWIRNAQQARSPHAA